MKFIKINYLALYTLTLLLSIQTIKGVYNGFDMSQDMPIDNLPLLPDRLYTPAGNYSGLLTRKSSYCRLCKKGGRRGTTCRRQHAPPYQETTECNTQQYPWSKKTIRRRSRLSEF